MNCQCNSNTHRNYGVQYYPAIRKLLEIDDEQTSTKYTWTPPGLSPREVLVKMSRQFLIIAIIIQIETMNYKFDGMLLISLIISLSSNSVGVNNLRAKFIRLDNHI